MKIIERRERQDDRLGRFRCQWCTSLVEVEKGDIPAMNLHRGHLSDPREADWWSIPCPVCGKEIALIRKDDDWR